MTGLLGGMNGRCSTLDNLNAGAATEGVSAGSMLVSRPGISCGRNDDLGGDKDMAAAPWGRGGVRCSWGRDISVAFGIKFIFTEELEVGSYHRSPRTDRPPWRLAGGNAGVAGEVRGAGRGSPPPCPGRRRASGDAK